MPRPDIRAGLRADQSSSASTPCVRHFTIHDWLPCKNRLSDRGASGVGKPGH
jgi:hypothetical protein